MKSPSQRDTQPVDDIATGFVVTMYFDMGFNYIRGSVEETSIPPDTSIEWESESCKLIPYVRYEYTQVCKMNPKISMSDLAKINLAREKVKCFASDAKIKGTVLTIVKSSIVTRLRKRPGSRREGQRLRSKN